MARDLIDKARRALRKNPRYIVRRLVLEVRAEAERYLGPARARRLTPQRLARDAGAADVDAWWQELAAKPYPHRHRSLDARRLHVLQPGAYERIVDMAERAVRREVDLLGSSPVALGEHIDWHRDFKSDSRWAPRFHRDIAYAQLDRPSDVKVPWELSRLQWALPLGQAWQLNGDARYARAARLLIDDWIEANPVGASVNWACTMEPALRILSWTWLFHVFAEAPEWCDSGFRGRFLQALYLHADFVVRNLEEADINGNHFTADAAGLVYAGLFFGDALPAARRWQQLGWQILEAELPRQVFPDGVDFEASVPYHRLVLELFAYPALYRVHCGLAVSPAYRQRLENMGRFVAAYSRRDGSTPWWGDADDGRALAFGMQPLDDHRYLLGTLAVGLDMSSLAEAFAGPRDEVAWLLGPDAAERLPARDQSPDMPSVSFPEGGFHILRGGEHHVFIDCGPLGLAGRGGHGHNDLLSFEAALHGQILFRDSGSYLYTASATERNRFRSTASHNTPQIDDQEINRFIRPDYLWTLHNDARHERIAFEDDGRLAIFEGRHNGYCRLPEPVTVTRRIELRHVDGLLRIRDTFEGEGEHAIVVPLHLAPGVSAQLQGTGRVLLTAPAQRFLLAYDDASDWSFDISTGRVSPSYGRTVEITVLHFRRQGLLRSLAVEITSSP